MILNTQVLFKHLKRYGPLIKTIYEHRSIHDRSLGTADCTSMELDTSDEIFEHAESIDTLKQPWMR